MALLEFNNLTYAYSDVVILDGAAGALQPGSVVGLVGVNGGGKSTLLRLLAGELTPEGGTLQRTRGVQLTYVSQAQEGSRELSLFAYVRGGRADLLELEARIAQLEHALEVQPDNAGLLNQLGTARARFEQLEGHAWELDCERLLLGLGFVRAQFPQPLGQLSGGQRQKAALARALLGGGQVLLLDEPTNHLDLTAQEIFASQLRRFIASPAPAGVGDGRRAALLVSHDRWLLDSVCTDIWELEDGQVHRYPGGYKAYLPARDLRRRQALETWTRQQEQIARTEEYIRRNIAGQNTRQARGRRTLLGRMERVPAPAEDPSLRLILTPQLATGEQVLTVENLAFAYGDLAGADDTSARSASVDSRAGVSPAPTKSPEGAAGLAPVEPTHVLAHPPGLTLNRPLNRPPVLPPRAGRGVIGGLSFSLLRGERLGIVGPNGCGKTTLLKLLTKRLAPQAGLVLWGSNVELGIFSQDSADLSPGRDGLAELRSVEPTVTDGEARSYLGRFGFSGDDVFKDVGALLGGERSRLSLAKLFRRRPNVLILDEPTNHLDIYAREALEQFLESYGGTVLLVTHDRALLQRLCDRLLIFEAPLEGADVTVRFFRGDYETYLAWSGSGIATSGSAGAATAAIASASVVDLDSARLKRPADISGAELAALASAARTSVEGYVNRQRERLARRSSELETQIAQNEAAQVQFNAEMQAADVRGDYTALSGLQSQLDALSAEHDSLLEQLVAVDAEAAAWQAFLQAD